jgi:phosphoribosylanthranilate isomerase
MADAPIVRVKICGLTNWADAKLAVDLGADALGFNFHPASPRAVSPAQAWEIVRRLPPMVTVVGVFVNWPAQAVAALARALHLDAVQLHGEESPREVRELAGTFRVIKAFRMGPGFRLASLAPYGAASAMLLDGFKAGAYGGTGRTADWSLARRARKYGRVILAGGIRPGNVAQAIEQARPYAVDVASGVEASPGKKDVAAMRELMREVEAANLRSEERFLDSAAGRAERQARRKASGRSASE